MADNSGITLAKAWVTIIPTTSGAEQAISDAIVPQAEKAGKDSAKGFGGTFAAGVGKVARGAAKVGGVAAAGAIVAKELIEPFVDAYATNEQLVGGVQKLYGAAGQSLEEYAASTGRSVEDAHDDWLNLMTAQKTVIDNSRAAYETAGMSANDYLDTVTGFSAALIQGLGGDTVAAAQVADVAIRDMSDNANTFGTDIESIQYAYQGFAKGNFTMLDNLKLGYGGTKEEMARLVNESGILADGMTVDASTIDDLSFDQYVAAIHAIQEQQQIAGTTANEASTTIEGSVNSAKAAWENWQTSIASGSDTIETDTQNLADSVGTAVGNVSNTVLTTLGGLLENGPATALQVGGAIGGALAESIGTAVAPLAADLDIFVGNIASDLGLDWEQIKTDAGTAWDGVTSTISGAWTTVQTEAPVVWGQIQAGLAGAWQGIQDIGGPIWAGISSDIGNAWDDVSAKAGEIWAGTIVPGLESAWAGLNQASTDVFGADIPTTMKTGWDTITTEAGQSWATISGALSNTWSEISADGEVNFNDLGTLIGTATDAVATDLGTKWATISSALGIDWEGIGTAADSAWQGIQGFITDPIASAATALGLDAATIKSGLETTWSEISSNADTTWQGIQKFMQDPIGSAATALGTTAATIQTGLQTTWSNVSSNADSTWKGIQKFMEDPIGNAATALGLKSETVKTGLDTAWSGISGIADTTWQAIQGFMEDPIGTAVSTIGADTTALTSIMNLWGIDDLVSGIFSPIEGFMADPIENAKGLIETATTSISGIISGLDLSLPSIALPHFNIYGGEFPWGIGGAGVPPEFSVEWYAKGGFVDGAELIGVGEAGPEMILPKTGSLMDQFGATVASYVAAAGATINIVINGNVDSVETADYLAREVGVEVSRSLEYDL